MERSKQLGEEKILKLLIKFSLPAIIGMLVNALYNVVDRAFIGNKLGENGIAGITVGFPIMLVIMAFAMLVGIGATSLFSIKLGEQKREEAETILGNGLVLLIFVSATISGLGLMFIDPLLMRIGASPDVLPYAREYLQVILWGTTFMCIGFGMNNFIRAEGNPKIAMITMFIGAALNIILDPIFIYVFEWGMRGAALATVISQAFSAAWVLGYFFLGKSSVKIHLRNLKPKLNIASRIVVLGFAPFAMQIAASFVNAFMNIRLETYGGKTAVAAMGIVGSIATLILMPMFGINQGAQPIIGYNYGAKRYDRVKETFKLAAIAATIIAVLGFSAAMSFPGQLVSIFNRKNADLIEFGAYAMRIFSMFFPLVGFQIVGSTYFQAIGKPVHSTVLSLSRQVLLLVPALFILPMFYGLNGVLFAVPVADMGSAIITGLLLFAEFRRLGASEEKSYDLAGFQPE